MHRIRTIAVGALVALALAACQGGVEGQTGAPSTPAASGQGSPATSASAAPSGEGQLFPVFQAMNGSNLTGGGIISDVEGGASVILGVVLPGVTDPLPAVIVEGDCASQTGQGPIPPPDLIPAPSASAGASPGAEASPAASPETSPMASPSAAASPSAGASGSAAPATEFPLWLTPIEAGSSNTIIGLSTSDLVASPHAILIERSPTDPTIIGCADLKEGPPSPPPGGGAGASPGASPGSSPAASPGGSPDAMTSPGASPSSS